MAELTPAPPPLQIPLVTSLRIGIGMWLVLGVGLLLFGRGFLNDHDATWWLWVPIAGAALGAAGIPVAARMERDPAAYADE